MKKVVYKLDLPDNKAKQKAMKAVSCLSGIDSISIDMNAKKLTVIGVADPVDVVTKLRKHWPADIISVGPAKEEQKKEEPKKEEPKKQEPKKVETKKEEAKKVEPNKEGPKKGEQKQPEPKKEEEKKKDPNDQIAELVKAYKAYNPQMTTHYYAHSIEENPNACVIC